MLCYNVLVFFISHGHLTAMSHTGSKYLFLPEWLFFCGKNQFFPSSSKNLSTPIIGVCACVWQSAIMSFEELRVAELDRKQAARNQQVISTTGTVWLCNRCRRTCSSLIGLFAHRRTHPSATRVCVCDIPVSQQCYDKVIASVWRQHRRVTAHTDRRTHR